MPFPEIFSPDVHQKLGIPYYGPAMTSSTPTTTAATRPTKTVGIAYLLFFLTGGFAGHRLYLGHTTYAAAFIAAYWLGLFMLAMPRPDGTIVNLATILGATLVTSCLIALLIDMIRLQTLVHEANHRRTAP
jgi:hypothetical protein